MKKVSFLLLLSLTLHHSWSQEKQVSYTWRSGNNQVASFQLNLESGKPLFSFFELLENGKSTRIVENLDPVFLLTVGKRDLISQNGWNIFFDKVPGKPHQSYRIDIEKTRPEEIVEGKGNRHIVRLGKCTAPGFTGHLEISFYIGSPLLNIAAVMETSADSTAILYDAGLISPNPAWKKLYWSDTDNQGREMDVVQQDSSINQAVKYRTIIGSNGNGHLALFPAPHQYFYPLDEAFNLKFTWYGPGYRNMANGYGIGIRQDLLGDKRFVPWFNAPPGSLQRLNFFCLLATGNAQSALDQVKAFTHNDRYPTIPGYKTLVSHFHNEFIMKVVLAGLPVPDTPNFKKVLQATGVDMVHLGEFHYTAHPKGPDSLRLKELAALHEQCKRLSDSRFLLMPGEEPNEFFGGHWLSFFPKPVNWIMSRKEGQPFLTKDPKYGKVYRIGNAAEMLRLLEVENGLAWTAHPRTKGSTGYPDKYKNEAFFKSDHFFGAAWKAIPADLSQPFLGNNRVLDLQNDMNNWDKPKGIIAEADLFTIEPENEMYAHLNVNYLQLDKIPRYDNGWSPVLDALRNRKFFSTTGEILIPLFEVNRDRVRFRLDWTFPMNYAEIVSGDGEKVYRKKIDLNMTTAFGKQSFDIKLEPGKRKWVRLEVWDIAANGAFTPAIPIASE